MTFRQRKVLAMKGMDCKMTPLNQGPVNEIWPKDKLLKNIKKKIKTTKNDKNTIFVWFGSQYIKNK